MRVLKKLQCNDDSLEEAELKESENNSVKASADNFIEVSSFAFFSF